VFPDPSAAKSLVPILSPAVNSSAIVTKGGGPKGPKKRPPSTKIFITAGALAFLFLLSVVAVFFYFFHRRLRRLRRRASSPSSSAASLPSRSATATGTATTAASDGSPDSYLKPELDATATSLHEAPGWHPAGEMDAGPVDRVLYELPTGDLPQKPRAELPARGIASPSGLAGKLGDEEIPPPTERLGRIAEEGENPHVPAASF
jgi:hypothetical protein